jgi:hypothetical protein
MKKLRTQPQPPPSPLDGEIEVHRSLVNVIATKASHIIYDMRNVPGWQ